MADISPPAHPGRVVTFYSYKGGTGRSLALANVAWILANNGLRVLVIDWDLEAPGLNRYFAPFLIDPDLRECSGLIDMVWDFATESMSPTCDVDDDSDWFKPIADFRKYAVALRYDFPDKGLLEFVPAGRQDAGYAERVGSFAWKRFYEEMGGGVFLETAREKAVGEYDYVLIDSRTGVSDTSGVCTIHLPDSLVICFTANNQSIRGAAAVASTVRDAWATAPERPGRPKKIIPLLTRVDPFEKTKLNLRRDLARVEFAGLLPQTVGQGRQELPELPYIAFFSYEETLATFADRPGEREAALLPALERLTGLVTDGQFTSLGKPPNDLDRRRILDQFEGKDATISEIALKTVATERYDVFLSYSGSDRPIVEELALRLMREGIRPWFDRWNLIPGTSWDSAIVEAFRSCNTIAFFVGAAGLLPAQTEILQAVFHEQSASTRSAPSSSPSPSGPRIIPVLLPGVSRPSRGKLPPILAATSWVEFRESLDDPEAFPRLVAAIRGVVPGSGTEELAAGEAPYLGLNPFDAKHAALFFGRESLIDQSIKRIRDLTTSHGSRSLAILGASGSGKSSLLRVGILGALKGGALEGSDAWPVAVVRPGQDPVASLAQALSSLEGEITSDAALEDARTLRNDPTTLVRMVRRVLAKQPKANRLVVVVDQFEEVLTLCNDSELQRAFIDNLLAAAAVPNGPTIVLVALQSQYYDRCLELNPAIAELPEDRLIHVGPMTRDELKRAIEYPARRAGVELEPGLVELLLEDVRDQAAALPLLQLTLRALWDERDGRRLTLRSYNELGRLSNVLIRHAEKVYATLTNTREQEACRRVFLRLIVPGEGVGDTRRRATLNEVLPNDPSQAELVRRIIERLAAPDSRLITIERSGGPSEDITLEVTHEALIRNWPRLRHWIDEDREALRIRRLLAQAANEWVAASPEAKESTLFTGSRLAATAEWAATHQDEMGTLDFAFLSASREREQKRMTDEVEKAVLLANLRRRMTRVLAASLILTLALAGTAGIQWRAAAYQSDENARLAKKYEDAASEAKRSEGKARDLAREATDLAKVATSRQLAAFSSSERTKRLDRSLLLAVEAIRTADTFEARASLFKALQDRPGLMSFLHVNEAGVRSVAFSPDGRIIAAGYGGFGGSGGVILWDAVRNKRLTEEPLVVKEGSVSSVAFSPDGKTLAAGWYGAYGTAGGVILWDTASGTRLEGQPLAVKEGDEVTSLAFSPDGKTLAAGYQLRLQAAGGVVFWDRSSRKRLTDAPLVVKEGLVTSVAFSPDGKMIATANGHGSKGSVVLWNISDLQRLTKEPLVVDGFVNSVAFSPDSKTIVAGYIRNSQGHGDGLALWDVSSQKRLTNNTVEPDAKSDLTSVAFSPDGKTIIAGYSDGIHSGVMLWDVALGRRMAGSPIHVNEGNVLSVAFSPDGKTIIAGYTSDPGGGGVMLLETARNPQLAGAPLSVRSGRVSRVAFSPDGKAIAVTLGSNVTLWDTATRQQLIGDPLTVPEGDVTSGAFSPDGKTLIAGYSTRGYSGGVVFWDTARRQRLAGDPQAVREGGVSSVAFSPDGKTIAAGYRNIDVGGVTLWDASSRKRLGGEPLTVKEGFVYSVAFSPDGKTIAAGYSFGGGGGVMLWDASSRKRRMDAPLEVKGQVVSVAFAPDGKTIVAGYSRAAYQAGGSEVGYLGAGVVLWDAASRVRLGGDPLTVREDRIAGVSVSPDGKTIACGYGNGYETVPYRQGVALWNIATRRSLFGEPLLLTRGFVESVAFSPDGKALAAGYSSREGDTGVILWNLDRESWERLAGQIANRNFTREEWTQYFPEQPYQATFPDLPIPAQAIAPK